MSLHDYHLIGYAVDGKARRIVLRTEWAYPGTPYERRDVVFDGVEAYSFRYDCFANIVFDICDQPLDEAIEAHWREFEAGHMASGWPRFWQGDESKTREKIAALVAGGAKWFALISSYGMEGWVLCHSIEMRVLPSARP